MAKRVSKKGIDNKIATILLIAFVIIILLLAFLWGRNFIESRSAKSGLLAEKSLMCESVQITATEARKIGQTAHITLENVGEVRIEKVLFRVEGQPPEELYDVLFAGNSVSYEVVFAESLDDVDELQVVPWLQVADATFIPCSNKVLTLNLRE